MRRLEDTHIALIGGAGFIGHHLALQLARHRCRVDVVDSLQVNNLLSIAAGERHTHNRELHMHIITERLRLLRRAGVRLHTQDARDYHALSRLLASIDPHVIVHLAAVSHAGLSNKDPHSTFDHSLRTLENALDAARSTALHVRHFVYFSSSMVYGHFHTQAVTEDTPCEPVGIYGALKLAGERMVIAYNQVFGLPYTIVRPSALYGERCVSRRVGQAFIEDALSELAITVYGDGRERLDFTYIDDLVQGVIRVLTHDAALNTVFNLTFGCSRSVADLIDIVSSAIPGLRVSYVPQEEHVPVRGTLSVERARSLLGYRPRYPLERGFLKYIRWYQSAWKSVRGTAGASRGAGALHSVKP